MSGTFTMPPQASANVNNPPAGYYRYFIGDGTDNSAGVFYRKDSAGAVVPLVPIYTQYTDEAAQDAVGNALVDSSTIDFTYDDGANAITAVVKDGSITMAKMDQAALTEFAQDAVAAMLNGDSTIQLVYNDAANSYAVTRAAITGDVAVPAGSNTSTIGANKVTNGMLAQAPAATVKGNADGANAGNVADLTQAQLTALINAATTALSGAMSAADKTKLNAVALDPAKVRAPASVAPGTVLSAAGTATKAGSSVTIPAGALQAGTTIQILATINNTAALATLTPTLRFGANDSNADASLVGAACGAGTAAVGGALVVATMTAISATQVMASIQVFNNGTTGVTNAACTSFVTTAPVTVSNSAQAYLGLYLSESAANVITIRTVSYDVISQ